MKKYIFRALILMQAMSFQAAAEEQSSELKLSEIWYADSALEISGIMKSANSYYIVSDNRDDHHLYAASPKNKRLSFKSILDLNELKGGKKYKRSLKDHKELKKKNRRWDLEGMANCGDTIYLINERVREVVRVDGKKSLTQLPINFKEVYPDIDKGGANAGFEGIAVDCKSQHLYLAKERGPRHLFKVDLKTNKIIKHGDITGSNRQGQKVIHFVTGDGLMTIGPDIADLAFDKGYLYVLERNTYEVTKVDPATFKVIKRLSYLFSEHLLYEPTEPFGLSEALLLEEGRILIGVDNNGMPLSTIAKQKYGISGTYGSIMVLERPKGF